MPGSWDSVFDEMEKAKPSVFWVPAEVGDTVVGRVTDISDETGDFGPFRRVTLEARDGSSYMVNGFGKVLGARLDAARLGDFYKIEYLGKQETKDKKATYKNFGVVHRKGPAWDNEPAAKPAVAEQPPPLDTDWQAVEAATPDPAAAPY
jgi:hypothetical protein